MSFLFEWLHEVRIAKPEVGSLAVFGVRLNVGNAACYAAVAQIAAREDSVALGRIDADFI
jgi:hypothetical protein